jgi:predicted ATPase
LNDWDESIYIVGKNNLGKSCLLEALRIYAENASPKVLAELILERGENWEFEMRQYNNHSLPDGDNPLRYLFHGYHFPQLENEGIEIGPVQPIQERLKLRLHAYQTIETKEGQRFSRIDEQHQSNHPLAEIESVIEIEANGEIKSLIRLSKDLKTYLTKRHQTRLNVQVVPTQPLTPEKVAVLWDNINVQPTLRKAVFQGLQLIDEKIQELVLVGRNGNITPILIYNDHDKRLPLPSLGDGMTHLFHILLALLNARDGLLLIDEFENGLHYTVQPPLWNLIFKLANELNVQVFATTHSWDGVTAFEQAAQNSEEAVMLFRLGRSVRKSDNGKVIAIDYAYGKLQVVTEAKLEVRG